nr:preprotein translocase subunit SecE [uncultured Holophaga sp.]
MIAKIKHQAKDLALELKRVDWPSKDKVLGSTYAVVAVSVFVGVFLWGADWVISWGMNFVLPHH